LATDARVPLYAGDDSALRTENFRALLARVDIQIEVPSVKYEELRGLAVIEDSAAVRVRVIEARKRRIRDSWRKRTPIRTRRWRQK
jgi:predicted ATPase with chaperone activity